MKKDLGWVKEVLSHSTLCCSPVPGKGRPGPEGTQLMGTLLMAEVSLMGQHC